MSVVCMQAKAATKQADGQSEAAAGTAATAVPSAAEESAPAELTTQPELEAPKASSAVQPEQSIADSSMKKRKRKAEADSVDPESAASGEAIKDEQTGIKRKGKAGENQDISANGHSVGNGKPEQDANVDGTEAIKNGNLEAQPVKLRKQKKQKQAAAAEPSGTGAILS